MDSHQSLEKFGKSSIGVPYEANNIADITWFGGQLRENVEPSVTLAPIRLLSIAGAQRARMLSDLYVPPHGSPNTLKTPNILVNGW